jgi:preprotein translocase subunit SecA
MAFTLLTKIFGSRNDRLLKHYRKLASDAAKFEASVGTLDDDGLRAKTEIFKNRLVLGETLEALLPEVFAVVQEASKRVMKMRHFDVQMVGGAALHEGKVAEMRTGEGKTWRARRDRERLPSKSRRPVDGALVQLFRYDSRY